MQYYPQNQQNQQPPVQQYAQPRYPYNQPPLYQPPVIPPEERYRRSLRRTVNGLGGLLLVFFGLEFILATILQLILVLAGAEGDATSSGMSLLLLNGVVSTLIFFLSGLIYCFIKKVNFGEVFPFDKISGSLLPKLCVIGLAFSLMSNYVVDLLNNTFGIFGIQNSGGEINAGSQPSVVMYFLAVAILPAFAEEFAFRGVLMGVLRPYSEALAILVSSAAFALMHGNFVQLPFTFCCGLVFGFIDIKTNSLLPSVIVHFLNNCLSVMFDIFVSYEIMNTYAANMWYGIIFVITGALAFIFIMGLVRKDESLFKLKDGGDVIPFRKKLTTTASSPTMLSYAILMLIYCAVSLIMSQMGIV